jgi:hypothetical protein
VSRPGVVSRVSIRFKLAAQAVADAKGNLVSRVGV